VLLGDVDVDERPRDADPPDAGFGRGLNEGHPVSTPGAVEIGGFTGLVRGAGDATDRSVVLGAADAGVDGDRSPEELADDFELQWESGMGGALARAVVVLARTVELVVSEVVAHGLVSQATERE